MTIIELRRDLHRPRLAFFLRNRISGLAFAVRVVGTRRYTLFVLGMQVGTKFQAGIPLVGKKEISVDVTASYEHTWGSTESETKTWSVHDNCVANAGVRLTCEFFVTKVCF